MIPRYRAWDKDYKKMLEVENMNWFNGKFESIGYGLTSLREANKIDLMQSTGLRDKNGREIFEGDIVTDGDVISDIKYHQTLGFYMIGKYGFSVPFGQGVDVEYFEEFAVHVSKTFEVIGNIYENPEILEDNK